MSQNCTNILKLNAKQHGNTKKILGKLWNIPIFLASSAGFWFLYLNWKWNISDVFIRTMALWDDLLAFFKIKSDLFGPLLIYYVTRLHYLVDSNFLELSTPACNGSTTKMLSFICGELSEKTGDCVIVVFFYLLAFLWYSAFLLLYCYIFYSKMSLWRLLWSMNFF